MNSPGATPPPTASQSSYKWWVVFMLWFVCFFNYADRQSITALFPLLQKEFGFDDVQLGWIVPAFAWVYAGFSLPAGLLVDRVSRKHVILAACIVWSAFTLGTAFCGGFAGFIIVRALTGLGALPYYRTTNPAIVARARHRQACPRDRSRRGVASG